MKPLRLFAALSGFVNRIYFILGTGFIFLLLSMMPAHADDAGLPLVQDVILVATSDSSTVLVDMNSGNTTQSSQQKTTQESTTEISNSIPSTTSIETKIHNATVTLSNSIESATATLQAIPNVQQVLGSSTVALQAVDSATVAINSAYTAIDIADSATASITNVSQLIDSQTAIVAIATETLSTAQTTVESATSMAGNAQGDVLAAMLALPALAAATDCVPGSACVNFYTLNAELGPIHDQIAVAQAAADAAVVAAPIAQAAADASVVTITTNGVKATVYAGTGRTPAIPADNATPILTTMVSQIAFNWGNGSVLGGPGDRVIVKFEGTITVPDEAVAVKYAV